MNGAMQWFKTHQKDAALGGAGLLVALLALSHRKKTAAAAAAAAALPGTQTGGIGIPNTTLADIQSAVQDQINAEIGHIPAGPPGAPGKTGATGGQGATGARGPGPTPPPKPPAPKPAPKPKPRILGMYEVNANRIHHQLHSISLAEYKAQYPGGLVQNAAQTLYMNALDAQLGRPAAAPKPRPTVAAAAPRAIVTPHAAAAAPRPRAAAAVPAHPAVAIAGTTHRTDKYGRLIGTS